MAADNNASVEFTLQMAFKKEIISVEHTSLTMSSLIDIACVFIDEKVKKIILKYLIIINT